MRIWLVNQYAVPPSQAGITRHWGLARELQRRGHEVAIVASSFDHLTRRETRLGPGERWRVEEVDGVPFCWIRTAPYAGNSGGRVYNMLQFAALVAALPLARRLGRPNVVLGSSPHLFGAMAASLVADRLGARFVLEVRDLWPESLVAYGGLAPGHPAVRGLGALARRLYRRADRLITPLPGAAALLAAQGADPARIHWVPNGVDVGAVPAPTARAAGGPFTVMYAGSHGLINALDVLVDGASRLQAEGFEGRIAIRAIGDGPDKARLAARAEAEGVRILRFEPPVAKAEIFGTMQQADAFVVTAHAVDVFAHGSSLNKVYDGMACARPFVFGLAATPDPIAEAGAGLSVAPADPAALAEGIKALAAMPPAALARMGARGRRYVERNHDLRRLGGELERALRLSLA